MTDTLAIVVRDLTENFKKLLNVVQAMHAEVNHLAIEQSKYYDRQDEIFAKNMDRIAELRDELHTLANRHGWSVKA